MKGQKKAKGQKVKTRVREKDQELGKHKEIRNIEQILVKSVRKTGKRYKWLKGRLGKTHNLGEESWKSEEDKQTTGKG